MLSLVALRTSQSLTGETVVGRARADWRRRAPSIPGLHVEHRLSPGWWSRSGPSPPPRSSVDDTSLMDSPDAYLRSLGVRGRPGPRTVPWTLRLHCRGDTHVHGLGVPVAQNHWAVREYHVERPVVLLLDRIISGGSRIRC